MNKLYAEWTRTAVSPVLLPFIEESRESLDRLQQLCSEGVKVVGSSEELRDLHPILLLLKHKIYLPTAPHPDTA